MALFLATTLTLNSFQLAMADSQAVSVQNNTISALDMTDAEIAEILDAADVQSKADLEKTLKQVQLIRKELKQLLVKKSDDRFLDIANKLQAALSLISASISGLNLSKAETTNITLAIATGTIIINTAIRHYTKDKNITTQQMSEIVGEATQQILAETKDMSPEMRDAVLSINSINLELQTNLPWAERLVDKSAGTQDYIALGSAVYLALHLITPKLTRQTDGIIKKYLPLIQAATQKGLAATKKTTVGATGVSSIPDLIGLAVSMGSPEARETVIKTLTKLNETEILLKTEISKIDKQVKVIERQ